MEVSSGHIARVRPRGLLRTSLRFLHLLVVPADSVLLLLAGLLLALPVILRLAAASVVLELTAFGLGLA